MPTTDDILAERGRRYGDFDKHADIAQSLKKAMASTPGWQRLAPDQREALEMNAHKIGRVLNGDPNYADNWEDIAGYAKLVANRLTAQTPKAEPAKPTPPFKVGDKVRIAEQINKGKYESHPGWADEMDETLGKLGTVSGIDDNDATVRVKVEGGAAYGVWRYRTEDLSAADKPEAEAEAETEYNCPACTLRKALGATEVEIFVSSGEGGPTSLADLIGELTKHIKPQK